MIISKEQHSHTLCTTTIEFSHSDYWRRIEIDPECKNMTVTISIAEGPMINEVMLNIPIDKLLVFLYNCTHVLDCMEQKLPGTKEPTS